ncbi:MAG TPA: uracil-DNA glycosylase family protein [Alcanivoracaceae bacterium]|nr:uracil-DNA glycosylase family protein [Alcanivoracaceae bacterium]
MSALIPLVEEVLACTLCAPHLPLGPRPVLQVGRKARLLIIGQAPSLTVHNTGVLWNDMSGDRLRDWLQLDKEVFYDPSQVALMGMGFCYPGRGKSGDLPPRPECAPQWHERLLNELPNVQLTLLIGQYAQQYYLADGYRTLTERLLHWRSFPEQLFALPHPSPRNRHWLAKNPWFNDEVLPELRRRCHALLAKK